MMGRQHPMMNDNRNHVYDARWKSREWRNDPSNE